MASPFPEFALGFLITPEPGLGRAEFTGFAISFPVPEQNGRPTAPVENHLIEFLNDQDPVLFISNGYFIYCFSHLISSLFKYYRKNQSDVRALFKSSIEFPETFAVPHVRPAAGAFPILPLQFVLVHRRHGELGFGRQDRTVRSLVEDF